MIRVFIEKYRLFSIYSEGDKEVCKKASEYGYYIIGGTALEIWCNHLGVKFWRQRSINDIDLYEPRDSKKQIFLNGMSYAIEFLKFLKTNGYEEPDIYYNKNNKDKQWMFENVEGYNVMHPVWLFVTKFKRYLKTDNLLRKEKDRKDLLNLLECISKLNCQKKLIAEIRVNNLVNEFKTLLD